MFFDAVDMVNIVLWSKEELTIGFIVTGLASGFGLEDHGAEFGFGHKSRGTKKSLTPLMA